MTSKIRVLSLGATCLSAGLLFAGGFASAADQTEPFSKTCRVTQARNNAIQKHEPFKAFDNLFYVGPCYVSVWLLTTPQGDILFDTTQEPFVDDVIANIQKVGVNIKDIKYIILSHGHLDHAGGAARLQELSGARVMAMAEDWDMIADLDGKKGNRDPKPNRMPKRDMVVKEGDKLDFGGQHLLFHHQPGHTPGVLTTEGITVFDNGKPYRAILMGGAGYRGGVKEAQQSVETAAEMAKFQGVQVNLQIHSWSGPNGYLRGGVLERGFKIKDRKASDPNPFVDPEAWTDSVKRTQEQAAKDLEKEKQKAAAK